MNLNKNSKFWRYVYMLKGYVPSQTSLCALFWRTVFALTLQWVILVVVSPILALIWAISYPAEKREKALRLRNQLFHERVQALRLQWSNGEITQKEFNKLYDQWFDEYCRDNDTTPVKIRHKAIAMLDRMGEWPVWKVLYEGSKTIKGKFCPIVRFSDE